MTWQKYDLVFRLLAPMHVGWRKTSNLQQTRGYVTGKLFWAALTARLTREAGKGANGKAYDAIGKEVKKAFRFTYFYPALQSVNGYKTYYPWEMEDEFDYLFLDSYTSTALNYASKSAADGLLHETEFIAPCTRENQPVYLMGNVYVHTHKRLPQSPIPLNNLSDEVKNWQQVLDKFQFGGERGYGWGRVQLVSLSSTPIQGKPVGELVNGRLPAHLETTNLNGLTVNGPIEPLLGWERNNADDKYNWSLSQAEICYAPGAVVPENSTFTITENGRWQAS